MGFGQPSFGNESRVLTKKNTKKENSPATDSRTQTSFQTFHTAFPVILYSLQKKKITKISTSLYSDPTPSQTNQHRSSNSKSPIKTHFFAHVAVTFSQQIWPFFFLEHHTRTHSYRLSAIFSLRINFTTLSSLSLLKRSIERRIRVLSAIDSLQLRLRYFISLWVLLFNFYSFLFFWLMRFACWFWWKVC